MTAPIIEGAEPLSVAGSDRGVLVLHGLTGNPQSMRPLADGLATAGFTVEMPLLPGHGTAVEDMVPTRFDDWSGAAEAAYADLAGRCASVGVVGLSMGGALTAWLAAEHAEIAGIACLNAIVVEPEGMRELIQGMVDGGAETMPGIGSDIAREGSIELAYPEAPLRALLSLMDAAGELGARLGRIECPVLVVNSPQDHVVDPSNSDVLASGVSGPVERVTAPDSYHVVTLDNDADAVVAAVVEFFDRVLG